MCNRIKFPPPLLCFINDRKIYIIIRLFRAAAELSTVIFIWPHLTESASIFIYYGFKRCIYFSLYIYIFPLAHFCRNKHSIFFFKSIVQFNNYKVILLALAFDNQIFANKSAVVTSVTDKTVRGLSRSLWCTNARVSEYRVACVKRYCEWEKNPRPETRRSSFWERQLGYILEKSHVFGN